MVVSGAGVNEIIENCRAVLAGAGEDVGVALIDPDLSVPFEEVASTVGSAISYRDVRRYTREIRSVVSTYVVLACCYGTAWAQKEYVAMLLDRAETVHTMDGLVAKAVLWGFARNRGLAGWLRLSSWQLIVRYAAMTPIGFEKIRREQGDGFPEERLFGFVIPAHELQDELGRWREAFVLSHARRDDEFD